jgi:hypothetical protein
VIPPHAPEALRYRGSVLRMNRRGLLFHVAKPSLLLIVACDPPKAERGNAPWSCLYSEGYVKSVSSMELFSNETPLPRPNT